MNAKDCPPVALLQEFLAGTLAPDVEAELDTHIASCSHCASRLGLIQPHGQPQPPTVTIPPLDSSHSFTPPVVAGELGQFGKYRIERELGRGGMGAVFLGFDTKLQRAVAIKLMATKYAANEQAKGRFLREARAAARIGSEHVIGIYEAEEIAGVPYIAMPYLQGCSLQSEIERRAPLPPEEVLRIGWEIAQGLADAHALGIVHRDIKPSNIWLEQTRATTPKARLLDFGLAHREDDDGPSTATGVVMGTPAYMAPEQARGETVDARADLWSLGVVLYELSTGQRPFTGPSTMAILGNIAAATPIEPAVRNEAVSPALSAYIMQLLAKDPAQRPATAMAVRDELDRFASGSTPVAPRPQFRRLPRRTTIIATLLLLFAVALSTVAYSWSSAGTGTLLLTCDDPELELTIEYAGKRLVERSRERQFALPPGTYMLILGRPNEEYRLTTNTVTIRRREETPVTATAPRSTAIRIERPQQRIILNASLTELRKWLDECQERGHIPIWFAASVGAPQYRVHAVTRLNSLGHVWNAAILDIAELAKNVQTFGGSHRLAFACPLQRGDERNRIMLWVKDGEAYATAEGNALEFQTAINTNHREAHYLTSLGGEFLGQAVRYYGNWQKKVVRKHEIQWDIHADALVHVLQQKAAAGYQPRFVNCFGRDVPHYQICFDRETPLTRPSRCITAVDGQSVVSTITKCVNDGETLVSIASHASDGGPRYTIVTEKTLSPKAGPDRLFAEWATANGAEVAIAWPPSRYYSRFRDLPATPFEIVGFRQLEPKFFNEEAMYRLAQLPKLKAVMLINTKVPAASFSLLSQSDMEEMHLNATTINDDHAKNIIAHFPKLRQLSLGGTRVSDKGLTNLKSLVHLQHLELGGTDITDATLPLVGKLEQLEYLSLTYTSISDTQLAALTNLQKLRWLGLTGTRTTARGVAQLRASLPPDTKIVWLPPSEHQVTEARSVLGLTQSELRAWAVRYQGEYHIAWFGLRAHTQPPLFDAVAVRTPAPFPSDILPVPLGMEEQTRNEMLAKGFCLARFFRYRDDNAVRFVQLFLKQPLSISFWTLYPADMAKVLKDYPQQGFVPAQFQNRDQMEEVLGELRGRWEWTIEKNLTVAKLPTIVNAYREKKWRPLFLNLDTDPGPVTAHFGFAENIQDLKWDYSHRLTEVELTAMIEAKRKENLRPMNICSYVEEGKLWFLVTWIEFRPAK